MEDHSAMSSFLHTDEWQQLPMMEDYLIIAKLNITALMLGFSQVEKLQHEIQNRLASESERHENQNQLQIMKFILPI